MLGKAVHKILKCIFTNTKQHYIEIYCYNTILYNTKNLISHFIVFLALLLFYLQQLS